VIDDGLSGQVEHSIFTLQPHAQGAGFAARFNANAEQAYREAGIDIIRLVASLDVGGYAWARQGYVLDKTIHGHEEELEDLKKRVREETSGETAAMSATREKMLDLLDRNDMAGLAAMPLGKKVLLGSKWHGVKRLV
jgi:predicted TIM-barrel enzyme